MSSLNGVLPVDKPIGPTSHDIVARARRALGLRRIGHTGTLDPFASGLLLLCLGPATRLAEYLTALPKSYSATLALGARTDTDDREGTVIESSDRWVDLSEEVVVAALARQTGELLQIPPNYSAKKIAGERMYDRARRQEVVDVPPVRINVYRIELTRFAPPEVDFDVDCSSGTYIRSIARDVGIELGVGAHLTALRRTAIGTHRVEAALPVEQLDDLDAVAAAMISPVASVAHLPRIDLDTTQVTTVTHGKRLPLPAMGPSSGLVALVGPGQHLVAIGEVNAGEIQPRKVFV